MKLNRDQIHELYKFTRKHFVEHYDLQTELVDHLANGIEAQWLEYPERSFKDARLREFRKFGVSGFEKVVRKRKNAMTWRYFKIILGFYKEYFRLPKILLTIVVTGIVTYLFKLLPLSHRYDLILIFYFGLVGMLLFIQFKKRKNNELEMVKYGKKWMLKDQIYSYGNFANTLNLLPILLNTPYFKKNIPVDNDLILLGFAWITVCTSILCYVIIYIVPKKAEELLAETYPEYKMG